MEGNKEKRLEETDKILAEANRRGAEVLSKIMGSTIEDIDRTRKKSSALSLIARIDTHLEYIKNAFSVIGTLNQTSPFYIANNGKIFIKTIVDTYKSIREDFKIVTKMDDKYFGKLFPERQSTFEKNFASIFYSILSITEQEGQIKNYLKRFI